MTNNYNECLEFLSSQFSEVTGYDFYRNIFPHNQNEGEKSTRPHPNAIYLYKPKSTNKHFKRRIMFKDTWENDYVEYVESSSIALCSGLSYLGKANLADRATVMNALIFDLDNVGLNEIKNLFHVLGGNPEDLRRLPQPTYVVLSGSGVHVYYVFDEPIALYPNIKLQLKQLKYDLTFKMWNWKATTKEKRIQYQPISQGFRMVGSINDNYGVEVKAFSTGEKASLDYVNQYAKEENRVDVNRPFRPSQITKAEAAKEYPEWYHRKYVLKERYKKKSAAWNGDSVYKWWLNKKISEATAGHRYFFMMCLAIFAYKCDVPKEQLKKDIRVAFDKLKEIEHQKNELTQYDIDSALEAYGGDYHCFKREDIEKLSAILIPPPKRNGRKREQHMKVMTAVRDVLHPNGSWRKGNGRPSAAIKVHEYRRANPDAKPKDCISDTGLSKNTVYKWWEWHPPKPTARAYFKNGRLTVKTHPWLQDDWGAEYKND